MHFFGSSTFWGAGGVPNIKIEKNLSIEVCSSQKSIYSIPTHLKPTLGPKTEKNLKKWFLAHFPLGFGCKNFPNFSKFFLLKIISKDTWDSRSSRPKRVGRYMHPSGTWGVLKKFCRNSGFTRKWEKLMFVPGGCTYLGWGAGQMKYHIIPLYHINIGF